MKTRATIFLGFAMIGVLFAAEQKPAAEASHALQSGTQTQSGYILGADDSLKIWALGVDEITDKPVRIDTSGFLDLPLIGRVHAAGLTVNQLEANLIQRLSSEIRDPRVSVEVVDFGSQPVTVIGAVTQPGVHQLQGRKTLAEVLSLAGGLKDDCGPKINISRSLKWGTIPLPNAKNDSTGQFSIADVRVKDLLAANDPSLNIMIEPNDVITVPQAEMVYVIGAVKKPGGFILNKESTVSVLQALSLAEGLGDTPSPGKSKILRPIPGSTQRQEIALDLKKVLGGKGEDVALRPNDILFVPTNTPKKAVAKAAETVLQTAAGVAIYRVP